MAELFGVVDVERRGAVGRAELAAGLIDWKAFEVKLAARLTIFFSVFFQTSAPRLSAGPLLPRSRQQPLASAAHRAAFASTRC